MTNCCKSPIFNAFLDLVGDNGYQLTESINDGIFLLMSVSNKNKDSNNSTTRTCGVQSVGRHDEFPSSIGRERDEMDEGTENPNTD